MTKRLIDFYRRNFAFVGPHVRDIWLGISTVYHTRLHAALYSGDEEQVRYQLEHFAELGGLHGIESMEGFVLLKDHPEFKKWMDQGVDFSLPDFGGFPCASNHGIPIRFTLYAKLALWIIKCNHGRVPWSVAEIGAGVGFLGVILCRMGTRRYTVIDLPTIAVFVAYFLSRRFGEDMVHLEGEPKKDECLINVCTCVNHASVHEGEFDVICNMNGFPEMPYHEQTRYLDLIANSLKPDGFFASVNHDSTYLSQRGVTAAMGEQNRLYCASKVPSEIITTSVVGPSGYYDEIYLLRK